MSWGAKVWFYWGPKGRPQPGRISRKLVTSVSWFCNFALSFNVASVRGTHMGAAVRKWSAVGWENGFFNSFQMQSFLICRSHLRRSCDFQLACEFLLTHGCSYPTPSPPYQNPKHEFKTPKSKSKFKPPKFKPEFFQAFMNERHVSHTPC